MTQFKETFSRYFEISTEDAIEAALETLKEKEHEELYVLLGMLYQSDYETEKAEESYKKACELAPESYVAHLALGQFYKEEYNLEEARTHLAKAAELKPCYESLSWWGISLEDEDAEQSREMLKKAIALGGSDECILQKPETYQTLAYLCSSNDEYQEAIDFYWKAIDDSDPSYIPHTQIIDAYISLEKYDEALETAEKYLELAPSNAMHIFEKQAEIYAAQGEVEKAIERYNDSIHWSQENAGYSAQHAYNEKATLLFEKLNRVDEAEETLLEMIDVASAQDDDDEPDAELYHPLLSLYEESGQHQKVIEFVETRVGDTFCGDRYEHGRFLRAKGRAHLALSHLEQAKAIALEAIELERSSEDGYELYADVCHALKSIDDAIAAYHRAFETEDNDWLYTSLRGKLIALGYYEEAVTFCDELIADDIKTAFAYFDKGRALFELGRYEDAIAAYLAYSERMPDTKRAQVNLFNCYRDMGEVQKALDVCNDVIENGEEFLKHFAYFQRAGVAYEQGKLAQAKADYEASLESKPDYISSLHDLAELYIITEAVEKGLALLEKASAASQAASHKAIRLFLRFVAHTLQGEETEAAETQAAFEQVAKGNELNFSVKNLLKHATLTQAQRDAITEVSKPYLG